jgi:suppressor of G2 allele of SKP1
MPVQVPSSLDPRHEYYETDEQVSISVFDRGADPEQVKVTFHPRKV